MTSTLCPRSARNAIVRSMMNRPRLALRMREKSAAGGLVISWAARSQFALIQHADDSRSGSGRVGPSTNASDLL